MMSQQKGWLLIIASSEGDKSFHKPTFYIYLCNVLLRQATYDRHLSVKRYNAILLLQIIVLRTDNFLDRISNL